MGRHRCKCFVTNCPNSVSRTPDKVFVCVNELLKRKWCRQLNISCVPQQRLYCCEDHLNLQEDLENYYEWKFMKSTPRLKSDATLYNYSFETLKRNTNMPSTSTSGSWIEELQEKAVLQSIDNLPSENLPLSKSSVRENNLTKVDAAVQCETIKMVNKCTLVKIRVQKLTPSKPLKPVKCVETSTSTLSTCSSMYGCTSETEVSISGLNKTLGTSSSQEIMTNLINKSPKMYIGLPKKYLWLVKHIADQMAVKELDLLITLFKIKLNDSMMRLADQFQISRPALTKSFHNGLSILANYLQNFVLMPNPIYIKSNLPLVFKIRYANVQCIIFAFEIEIEKPSHPQHQAQTWSQYKHRNTVKYLISCTPNGFINYISKGYGGRISDKALVEESDLMEVLPINAVIMADRGFKEVESLLMNKNIKLLRPPKEDVLQTKVIASLRVHIERVIRRVREFRFLTPHAVVSHKHVGYLDKIVLIACGLINFQDEIIKR